MGRKLAILGSTGSIGRQVLEVIKSLPGRFEVEGLAADRNVELLFRQVLSCRPRAVAVGDGTRAEILKKWLGSEGACVFSGPEGLVRIATLDEVDTVVVAVAGIHGLVPTLEALKAGKVVALANKETLVAGGELVVAAGAELGRNLLPVDSEHSAVFQCLQGRVKEVARIILTASGGPFRKLSREELSRVTPEEALRHPTWSMGKKITIDSATLMNKGLEVIEARWLFGISYERIEIVVHPESIIHSMVEFQDGSVIAQLAVPDMRLPIQYALTFPERLPSPVARLDLKEVKRLTFEAPDAEKFPCLRLAYEAGRIGGTMPAVLNAANEAAVEMFLAGKIGFGDIPVMVSTAMQQHKPIFNPSLEDVLNSDAWARKVVSSRWEP